MIKSSKLFEIVWAARCDFANGQNVARFATDAALHRFVKYFPFVNEQNINRWLALIGILDIGFKADLMTLLQSEPFLQVFNVMVQYRHADIDETQRPAIAPAAPRAAPRAKVRENKIFPRFIA